MVVMEVGREGEEGMGRREGGGEGLLFARAAEEATKTTKERERERVDESSDDFFSRI